MPRRLEAGVHEGLSPTNRLTAHAVLTGMIDSHGPALSSAPEDLENLKSGLLEGEHDGTCADMLTCVRRARAAQWCFHTPEDRQAFSTRSRSLHDTIVYALAPAGLVRGSVNTFSDTKLSCLSSLLIDHWGQVTIG